MPAAIGSRDERREHEPGGDRVVAVLVAEQRLRQATDDEERRPSARGEREPLQLLALDPVRAPEADDSERRRSSEHEQRR